MRVDEGELGRLVDAKDWTQANTYVEKQIAAMLPPNQRGIHANHFSS